MKEKINKQNQKSTKAIQNLNSNLQILTSDHRGITLIALIITIIIMLILVAATISVTLNNGLFAKAAKASKDWNEADQNIQGEVDNIGNYIDSIVEKYSGGTGECTEHEVEEWIVEKEVTCTEAGIEKGNCKKCGAEGTREIPATGHNWENGVCTKCGAICEHNWENGKCTICGLENNEPTISSVTLNNKTTSTFAVDVTATDVEETNLTYSLYISGENEPVATSTGSGTVLLEATNLGMYTDYTYYVTVTDNIETSTSGTNSVKTKCSGQTTTCATNECKIGSTVACTTCNQTGTCTICGGDGKVKCTHTNCTQSIEDGWTCNWCGAEASRKVNTCTLCSAKQRIHLDCGACGGGGFTYQWSDYSGGTLIKCSSCGDSVGFCSSCSGTKNIYTYCSHDLAAPHLYCDHYENTEITEHLICDHSTNGAEHE